MPFTVEELQQVRTQLRTTLNLDNKKELNWITNDERLMSDINFIRLAQYIMNIPDIIIAASQVLMCIEIGILIGRNQAK